MTIERPRTEMNKPIISNFNPDQRPPTGFLKHVSGAIFRQPHNVIYPTSVDD